MDPIPGPLNDPILQTVRQSSLNIGLTADYNIQGEDFEENPFSNESPNHGLLHDPARRQMLMGVAKKSLLRTKRTDEMTEEESRDMEKFEALDYFPADGQVHREYESRERQRGYVARIILFTIIGLATGLVIFLMRQTIDTISSYRTLWNQMTMVKYGVVYAWLQHAGVSSALVFLASICVILIPAATGSGVPEVQAYLNGTLVPKVFNFRTLITKMISTTLSVASGLPVGPEGPMVHLGAIIGAGVPHGRSKTLGFQFRLFRRFRSVNEHRDFVSAGAAAGLAAAFGAPIGGLLFVLEEVASFWGHRLTVMILMACVTSVFTTDLLMSAFSNWSWNSRFGYFDQRSSIMFAVHSVLEFNVLIVVPTLVIGTLGGLFGALFSLVNVHIVKKWRRVVVFKTKFRSLMEPVIVMIIFSLVCCYLPLLFPCQNRPSPHSSDQFINIVQLVQYNCKKDQFNAFATLSFTTGETVLRNLFSRETGGMFTIATLMTYSVIYFIFAVYSAGMRISSGIMVPLLITGATFGRAFGLIMVNYILVDQGAEWADPGIFALLGAAAMFSGVSRLTVSMAVILLEISGDVRFLLPIALSVLISKWFADKFTPSLYHSLLRVKCIPFLLPEPPEDVPGIDVMSVGDVMCSPVVCISSISSIGEIVDVLANTRHNGFPVLTGIGVGDDSSDVNGENSEPVEGYGAIGSRIRSSIKYSSALSPAGRYAGFILRSDLELIIRFKRLYMAKETATLGVDPYAHPGRMPSLRYEELLSKEEDDFVRYRKVARKAMRCDEEGRKALDVGVLATISQDERDMYIDLRPFLNMSQITVPAYFGFRMTYSLIRSMGLRHLVVVNDNHEVIGILTRKDLVWNNVTARVRERIDSLAD